MPESTPLANQLLIAMPNLRDPNFARGVAFLCQHGEDGAMGLMVNRLSEYRLGDVLAQMNMVSEIPEVIDAPVLIGGPVQPERGFVLHSPRGEWESSFRISDRLSVTTSRDILVAMAAGEGPRHAIVTLGYSGWSPGQLEQELRDNAWLTTNKTVVEACLQSMINRSGDVGFAQYDSTRCVGGQEITTYDSLDHSLAQTRNNIYIAVKSWATYWSLALMFRELGDAASQKRCEELAEKVASVVCEQAVDGVLPAIFEKNNPGYASRILPAVEGCAYPLYFVKTGFAGRTLDEMFATPAEKRMREVLKVHTRTLLLDPERRNLFADGGIKLSSTSNNSWMSKISIFMHVTRKVFGLDKDAAVARILSEADAAHVKWQTEGSSYWACCDQIVSGEGKASRYYPRIITSALWME